MINFTSEICYAAEAVRQLSEHGQLSATRLGEISNSPVRWLLQILRKLTVAGLLRAHRGVTGGYELAKPQISLLEIVEALTGPVGAKGPLSESLLAKTEPIALSFRSQLAGVHVT